MSPSHQERVRQNNCDHLVAKIESDLGLFQLCLKCGMKKEILKECNHVWAIQSNPEHCFTCVYCGKTTHNPNCESKERSK